MAASPADAVVARAFGGVIVKSGSAPGPASHDGMGARFVFLAAEGDTARYAIDVEPVTAEPSPEIVARLQAPSPVEALKKWTELEVRSKLFDIPVLALLCRPELSTASIKIERFDTCRYWIAIGRWSAADGSQEICKGRE